MNDRYLQRTGVTRNQRAWLVFLGTTLLALGLSAGLVRPVVRIAAAQLGHLVTEPAVRTSGLRLAEASELAKPDEPDKVILVIAKQMWTPTGISLEVGQVAQIRATGTATSTLDEPDPAFRWVGPDGWGYEPYFIPGRLTLVLGSSSSFMCLVGRIGVRGEPFKLGASSTFTVREPGALYVGINDALGPQGNEDYYFRDNCGSFQIRVHINPARGKQEE